MDVRRTARVTGLGYLGLVFAGVLSFMVIRPMVYVPGDTAATASNVADPASVARLGVVLELAAVFLELGREGRACGGTARHVP